MINDNDLFDALADVRRRELLVGLLDDTFRPVPELSDASREMAEASDAFLEECLSGSREVEGVDEELLRLHLVHLPKLDDCGFVDWHREAEVVTRGARYDEIVHLLELVDERDAERTVADVPDRE